MLRRLDWPDLGRVRRVTALVACLALAGAATACTGTAGTPSEPAGGQGRARPVGPNLVGGWRLAWSDDFVGSSLDRSRWSVEDQSTFGDGNQELACLMDRPANVQVSGGQLTLRARREEPPLACGDSDRRFPQGREFSAAMLSTQGHSSWTYGRFEIRARLPTAPGTSEGLWPAFWMKPVDLGSGEIDVLEAVGTGAKLAEASKVHQTILNDGSKSPQRESNTWEMAEDPSAGFHIYAVEWESHSLTWFVDGHRVYQRTEQTTPWLTNAFARPFFIRVNLAVGGSWPGRPTPTTVLPAAFDIDWVRVYQR